MRRRWKARHHGCHPGSRTMQSCRMENIFVLGVNILTCGWNISCPRSCFSNSCAYAGMRLVSAWMCIYFFVSFRLFAESWHLLASHILFLFPVNHFSVLFFMLKILRTITIKVLSRIQLEEVAVATSNKLDTVLLTLPTCNDVTVIRKRKNMAERMGSIICFEYRTCTVGVPTKVSRFSFSIMHLV